MVINKCLDWPEPGIMITEKNKTGQLSIAVDRESFSIEVVTQNGNIAYFMLNPKIVSDLLYEIELDGYCDLCDGAGKVQVEDSEWRAVCPKCNGTGGI